MIIARNGHARRPTIDDRDPTRYPSIPFFDNARRLIVWLRRAWSNAIAGALVIVVKDAVDFNLREAFELMYGVPRSGDIVRCYILGSITASSTRAAFRTGYWPAGVDLNVYNF